MAVVTLYKGDGIEVMRGSIANNGNYVCGNGNIYKLGCLAVIDSNRNIIATINKVMFVACNGDVIESMDSPAKDEERLQQHEVQQIFKSLKLEDRPAEVIEVSEPEIQ